MYSFGAYTKIQTENSHTYFRLRNRYIGIQAKKNIFRYRITINKTHVLWKTWKDWIILIILCWKIALCLRQNNDELHWGFQMSGSINSRYENKYRKNTISKQESTPDTLELSSTSAVMLSSRSILNAISNQVGNTIKS